MSMKQDAMDVEQPTYATRAETHDILEEYSKFDLDIDSMFLGDQQSGMTIAEVTAVAHPEGSADDNIAIEECRDKLHVDKLRDLNLKGKPVTMDHGEWSDKEKRWIRKPKVVGHVLGTKLDEHGRLLAYFALHKSGPGFLAESEIRNRIKVDVSPFYFVRSQKRSDGKVDYQYHCNHLALTPEGRHAGTHILAMKSKLRNNATHIRVKDKSIRERNDSTRKAADLLLSEDSQAIRDFFVGT